MQKAELPLYRKETNVQTEDISKARAHLRKTRAMPEAAILKEIGGKAKAWATAKETAKETAEPTRVGKRQTAILLRQATIITMAEAKAKVKVKVKAKVKAEKAIMAAKTKKVLTTTVVATLETTTAAVKAVGEAVADISSRRAKKSTTHRRKSLSAAR